MKNESTLRLSSTLLNHHCGCLFFRKKKKKNVLLAKCRRPPDALGTSTFHRIHHPFSFSYHSLVNDQPSSKWFRSVCFFFWIIFFVFYKVTISMRELFCIMRATPCCICLSVAKRSYGRYNNFREHVYLHRPRYSMMYWILQNVYILIIHECWALSWFVVLVKSISFAWKGVRLNVG